MDPAFLPFRGRGRAAVLAAVFTGILAACGRLEAGIVPVDLTQVDKANVPPPAEGGIGQSPVDDSLPGSGTGSLFGLPRLGRNAGAAGIAVGLAYVFLPRMAGRRRRGKVGRPFTSSNRRLSHRVVASGTVAVTLASLGRATAMAMVVNASLGGVAVQCDGARLIPGEVVRIGVGPRATMEAFVVEHTGGTARLRYRDSVTVEDANSLRRACLFS